MSSDPRSAFSFAFAVYLTLASCCCLQATFASEVVLDDEKDEVEVTMEVDDGLETVVMQLPAVVTCDLRLNEPRFATLPNIMKARKKKIEEISLSSFGVDIASDIEVVEVIEPPRREAGVIVDDVNELIHKLQQEAKVL